jgi:hypothetical protein
VRTEAQRLGVSGCHGVGVLTGRGGVVQVMPSTTFRTWQRRRRAYGRKDVVELAHHLSPMRALARACFTRSLMPGVWSTGRGRRFDCTFAIWLHYWHYRRARCIIFAGQRQFLL